MAERNYFKLFYLLLPEALYGESCVICGLSFSILLMERLKLKRMTVFFPQILVNLLPSFKESLDALIKMFKFQL